VTRVQVLSDIKLLTPCQRAEFGLGSCTDGQRHAFADIFKLDSFRQVVWGRKNHLNSNFKSIKPLFMDPGEKFEILNAKARYITQCTMLLAYLKPKLPSHSNVLIITSSNGHFQHSGIQKWPIDERNSVFEEFLPLFPQTVISIFPCLGIQQSRNDLSRKGNSAFEEFLPLFPQMAIFIFRDSTCQYFYIHETASA
jgi:hypothetical protein